VLVVGVDVADGQPRTQAAAVVGCTAGGDGRRMLVELDRDVVLVRPDSLRVRANVVPATHGETVRQVLGSGDGRASFARFRPRRVPLTHVRSTTVPEGAVPELEVRVDGVRWEQVARLGAAGPHDRVYALRHDEDGDVDVVFGDGVHGARLPTGEENVTATYRVGIGAPGAVEAGQLSLLVRRPLGVRQVDNPAPACDWAPPEDLEQARTNAPLRVRTLDRAVSVADHEDVARAYAGVGPARADLLWDGRRELVVVTVLGTGASPVSPGLLSDLRTTLTAVRDPGTPLQVLGGELLQCSLTVAVRHDPAHERADVEARVIAALVTAFGPGARTFATPVTAAAALVVVRQVPGVRACTVPRLAPPLDHADAEVADGLLVAAPARWEDGAHAAQLLALDPAGIDVAEMTP
jgi:predicted phage baseplate assembly protein